MQLVSSSVAVCITLFKKQQLLNVTFRDTVPKVIMHYLQSQLSRNNNVKLVLSLARVLMVSPSLMI